MTITTDAVFSGPYTATADDTFAVDFQSLSATEIRVTLDGVDVSPAAYNFNRDDDGTGEVVFDVAATGEVIIYSDPDFLQPYEFQRHGAFYPGQLNPALDRLVGYINQLRYLVDTSVGEAGTDGEDGVDGSDGLSAYEIAVANGYVGDEASWLASLEGTDGDDAVAPNWTFSYVQAAYGAGGGVNVTGVYPNQNIQITVERGAPGVGGLSDGTYNEIVISGSGSAMAIVNNKVTYAKMQDIVGTKKLLGAASPGDPGELGIDTILDWVFGTPAQGQIMYRNATQWRLLDPGTSGYRLTTQGAGANPAWAADPTTATTQSWGDATTKFATTAFVDRLRDLPLIRATASPTAALTDRGGVVEATTAAALPANGTVAFPVGSIVIFYNDSGSSISLTITTDTLRLAGTTSTGTRTIAPRGYAVCRKRATTEWTVQGDVS